MNLVQGPTSASSIPTEAIPPPTVPNLALPALNLNIDDLLEFFNFSVSDFMQLLGRCINMVLSGCDFLEIGRPMLNNYLDYIERMGVMTEQFLTESI